MAKNTERPIISSDIYIYSPRRSKPRLLQRQQRKFNSLENFHSNPSFPDHPSSLPGNLNAKGVTKDAEMYRGGSDHTLDSRATTCTSPEEEEILTDLQRRHVKYRRGKLVTFYRNGDPHFRGLRTSVSRKMFLTLETLLVWLNDKISTATGVKFIFSLPEGTEIRDITQFVGGRSYVVSSVHRIIHVPYGDSKERFWRNRSVENITPHLVQRQNQQTVPTTGRQSWATGDRMLPPATDRMVPARSPMRRRRRPEHDDHPSKPESVVLSRAPPLKDSDMGGFKNSSPISNRGEYFQPKATARQPVTGSEMEGSKNSSPISNRREYFQPKATARQPLTGSEIEESKNSSPISSRGEYFQPKATARQPLTGSEMEGSKNSSPISNRGEYFQLKATARQPLTGSEMEGSKNSSPITSRREYSHPKAITKQPLTASEMGGSKNSSAISSRGEYFHPKATAKPRILLIRSNTDRSSQQKVIFNPFTSQSYEDVLLDVGNMVRVKFPPVTALYTSTPPFVKVMGLSHLARDLKNCNEFIACGREEAPLEIQTTDSFRSSPERQRTQTDLKTMRPSKSLERLESGSVSIGGEYASADEVRAKKTFRAVSKSPHQKPFRKIPRESDAKQVFIHGQPREFYAPPHGDLDIDSGKPDKNLVLNWVYGYRGRDARNNLYVLPSGELLYYVGAVAVMYDRNKEKQRHFTEHNEDIMCMALQSEGGDVVATGQLSGKSSETRAHVRLWNPKTLVTYAILGKDLFVRCVSSVAFSKQSGDEKDGSLLVVVDGGERYTLSVWDWKNQTLIAKTSTTDDLVICAAFHPDDHKVLITFGSQHINFWKLFREESGRGSPHSRILRDKQSGIFKVGAVPNYVTALTFSSNGDVIIGDSGGNITVWSRNDSDVFQINKHASENLRNAHQKPVLALGMLEDGTLISGGGSEIKTWDSGDNFKLIKQRAMPEGASGFVRTLVPLKRGGIDGAFYVGTTSNAVLQGSLQNKFSYVIQGHSEELWAIASYPNNEPVFVTAGYDQYVCQWNATRHSLVWKAQVEKPCVSVDYDPSGRRLVVGTTVGRFIALSSDNGQHLVSIQVGTESLDVVKFSPDGRFLAVGCQDGNIYIYETLDDLQVFRRYRSCALKGHQNVVSHIDWSKSGHNLQSVSGDYDLLFWSVDRMEAITAVSAKNTVWATQSCTLGYDVLGPWSHLKEGEDINTMFRSSSGSYLAVGNNKGAISLYSYPSISQRPEHVRQKICTGNVTRVTFVHDDQFLLTSGGSDASVMQWSLVDARESP